MSRRLTPERIDAARHAATRQSLIGQSVTKLPPDAWIAAWEVTPPETRFSATELTGSAAGSGSPLSGCGGRSHWRP